MTESTIASVAGIIISLAFSIIPGLKDWYASLTGEYKRLVMIGVLLLAVGVLFASSCMGYATEPACTIEGAKSLVPLFIAAAIANQGTYLLTPQKNG